VARSNGTLTSPLEFKKEGAAITFLMPERVSVVGGVLKDPHEELPTSKDDPRVIDGDHDGHPGVTIHVKGDFPLPSGDIYVVQRTTFTLHGKRDFTDHFSGSVFDLSDQSIVDATNGQLMTKSSSDPQNDSAKNAFEMKRIEAALSCDELMAQVDGLF
jgi:hypothetical protein